MPILADFPLAIGGAWTDYMRIITSRVFKEPIMAKNLVIVESPAKIKSIEKYLGKDFQVLASYGHVRDLPEKKLGIDVDNNFAPEYEISGDARKKKNIDELRKAGAVASTIWLATDPDREGESISWHLYELLKPKSKAKFRRVTFNEITEKAVKAAFDTPHEIDQDMVDAQQARRVLDRLVGFKVSPLARKRGGSSAGRVQTVALRLIVEREKAIRAFVPEEYWSLKVKLARAKGKDTFIAALKKIDGKKAELSTEKQTLGLVAQLKGASFPVTGLTGVEKSLKAPPPFITSSLQQAASGAVRMSPTQTMRVAQDLYEGVDIGKEGSVGLITYMRTDSFTISVDAQQAALGHIKAFFGAEYCPAKPNIYKSKNSAQGAHEAIRPTDISRTPDSMKRFLEPDQLKLYTLIYNRFLASQMAPAKVRLDTAELEPEGAAVKNRMLFTVSATTTLFEGWKKAYNHAEEKVKAKKKTDDADDDEGEEEDAPQALPDLKKGEQCKLIEPQTKQHFTEPLPRFSEATLIRSLEENGVGRPSTYASIVKTIQDREYVAKDSGRLVPTQIGEDTCDFLTLSIPTLFEVKFTAEMEEKLDEIENGRCKWTDMMQTFYGDFVNWLGAAKTAGAPPAENFAALLKLFHAKVAFDTPVKPAKGRAFDDKEFVESLREALEESGAVTARQWQTLVKLAAKYAPQLKGLPALAKKFNFEAELTALQEQRAIAVEAIENPDSNPGAALLKALEGMTYDPPTKGGPRVYDDGKFVSSLRDQLNAGRVLTDNQVAALARIANKYGERDPKLAAAIVKAGFAPPAAAAQDPEVKSKIETLLAGFAQVKEWAPAQKKGKATFDDKEFVESLRAQFASKGQLSERQIEALGKLASRYREGAPALGKALEAIPKAAPETVDAQCPKCGKQVIKKAWKGRHFFACSGYPACKNSASTLDQLLGN